MRWQRKFRCIGNHSNSHLGDVMQSTFTPWWYIKEKKLVFCQIKTKQKRRQHQSRSLGIDPFGMWTFVQTLLTIHLVVVEWTVVNQPTNIQQSTEPHSENTSCLYADRVSCVSNCRMRTWSHVWCQAALERRHPFLNFLPELNWAQLHR